MLRIGGASTIAEEQNLTAVAQRVHGDLHQPAKRFFARKNGCIQHFPMLLYVLVKYFGFHDSLHERRPVRRRSGARSIAKRATHRYAEIYTMILRIGNPDL